jgi:alpha-D-ribose 1-methylphosphonate 5-triphosphate synthase subunit PhnG
LLERERRLEALSAADEGRLVALADEVLRDFTVEVDRGPSVGLLMVRVEEPSERLPFNFTEVTVSEAEVSSGPHRGYAMVMGRSTGKALAAAVLDAALEAGHPLATRIEAELEEALAQDEAKWRRRWARVAPTTATFEDVTG